MKFSSLHPRTVKNAGFTLVELLVVIGIIAILASVLLISANSVINSAKRSKANTIANQIQTACMNYYTEYGVYPVPPGTGAADTIIQDLSANQGAWGNLICSLSGGIQPSAPGTAFTYSATTPTNTRNIAFLSMKGSDVDSGNAPLNPLPTGTEIYFNIVMNGSYSGVMGTTTPTNVMPNFAATTFNAAAQAGGGTTTSGVALWANCNGSTSPYKAGFYVHTY